MEMFYPRERQETFREWSYRNLEIEIDSRKKEVVVIQIARRNVTQNEIVMSFTKEGIEARVVTQSDLLWKLAKDCPAEMEEKKRRYALKWYKKLCENWAWQKKVIEEKNKEAEMRGEGWYFCETGTLLWERGCAIVFAKNRNLLEEAFPDTKVEWRRYKTQEDAMEAANGMVVEAVTTAAEVADNRSFGRPPFTKIHNRTSDVNVYAVATMRRRARR